MTQTSSVTPLLKLQIAEVVKNNVFPTLANTYIGIGRPVRWGDDETELASEVEAVSYTTNYSNQVYRDMIALKKVEAADTALVVPRVDWLSGTFYDAYNDGVALFSYESSLELGTVDATGNTVTTNTAVFTGNVSVGNIITISTETKEVIAISGNTITLNTDLTSAYVNVSSSRTDNTYPQFANNFYCRNSKDQVFKCLFNANDTSITEPTIDIDGQLPENPYIETADGYKWKFLYSIPYGMKQKFFTRNWMPVLSDNSVIAGATDGRIDIVNITEGGTGYFLDNGESGNSTSLSIITVTGDGTGADITAQVSSGVITELNILDGGAGYTKAEIVVSDDDQLVNAVIGMGNTATFEVSISPQGGHGSQPEKELGCYSVMTSVDLIGTESDTIPVGDGVTPFDFRQITLLRDPVLANGSYAAGSVYATTTKLTLTDPGTTNFASDEYVYIGGSLAASTFSAIVVNWEPSTNELFVNNLSGDAVVGATLIGDSSAAGSTILIIDEPTINLFTGDLLYIENRAKIIRDVDQTEQIRLVLSF